MFYFMMACITMFVASTASFVIYNKQLFKGAEDLVFMLLMSLVISMVWFIAIPAGIILGAAWLIAKLFSLDWKQKNEHKTND